MCGGVLRGWLSRILRSNGRNAGWKAEWTATVEPAAAPTHSWPGISRRDAAAPEPTMGLTKGAA